MMKKNVFEFIKEFCIKKSYIREYIFISIFIMMNLTFSLIGPKYQAKLINILSETGRKVHVDVFINFLIIYIVIYALTYIMEYLKRIKIIKVAENISVDLRYKINEKLDRITTQYFEKNNSAQLMTIYNREIHIIKKSGIIMIINLLDNIIIIFFVIPVMFKVDGVITIIVSFLLGVYCIGNKLISKVLENINNNFFSANEDLNTNIEDNFNNWILSRFFNTEYFTRKVFNKKNEKYKCQSIRQEKYYLLNSYYAIAILLICILFTWLLGGYKVITRYMSVGNVILLINYLNLIFRPVNYISNFTGEYNMAKIAIGRIYDFLEYEEEIDEGVIDVDVIRSIKLNNIVFGYDHKKIFQDVFLNFEKGKIYVINGKNGSGKSTLIKIILGINHISSGEVLINDISIKNFSLKSYRSKISYISSNSQFFCGSILDNIKISNINDVDEIVEMCKKIDIHSDIMSMKNEYETEINKAHSNLSDGQAKRIELVRNLLGDPDVIIIDEGVYVLDKKRRGIIYQYLFEHKGDKIVIIITHNDYEIENIDVEYILQEGKVIRREL